MSNKDKWVRRFSVDQTAKHKNSFTIYKITSVLFPLESPEAVTVVSVWKRYSDVRRLHKSMRQLHAGLHLKGTFPALPTYGFFKRFQQEVIEERAKTIKTLLEFVAEHKLLFTSTDFVNFLQSGYPDPTPSGVINAIRSSLQLPADDTPHIERDEIDGGFEPQTSPTHPLDDTIISQIPVYESSDIERRTSSRLSLADSFESINSLGTISDDLYSELDKLSVDTHKPLVKRTVLPDLINFDAPSTSRIYDMNDPENVSLTSTVTSEVRANSRVSVYSKRSVLSLSNIECKTKTEDSYVFEAGYMLNLAARYEDMREYQRAFECYKAGIEKMLIGVQSDSDPQRRALIKEKTNKYLSYAEAIYKNHLCDVEPTILPQPLPHCAPPLGMLRRPRDDLAHYRALAVLGHSVMLVLHAAEQSCYAMKVIQKVPHNLTEFDEYFLQNTQETRQPILPTLIPYMVPLHSYIETSNLVFLILAYAPGEKLFDYIKNYTKSIPNTPAREVNLENVFSEPKNPYSEVKSNEANSVANGDNSKVNKEIDVENDNIDSIIEIKVLDADIKLEIDELDTTFNSNDRLHENISIIERIEANVQNNNDLGAPKIEKSDNMDNLEISVNELVINSQKLLLNVDKALSEVPSKETVIESDISVKDSDSREVNKVKSENRTALQLNVQRRAETPRVVTPSCLAAGLPPAALRRWAAEVLLAVEGLHNCGVVCRDLNPSNILLGDRGQIILTYFPGYNGLDMALSKVHNSTADPMYIAPELYIHTYIDPDRDDNLDKVCDFWSYGAVMYELLCGVPLSYHHRSRFTAHTVLHLPEALPLEVQSLLTQLLTYEPAERLGAGKDGIEEIKQHPYFKTIDWQQVYDSWLVPD